MAFPQQTPGAFTKQGVEALKPGQNGVYGIYRQGVWIYVGKGDLRERLIAHFNGDNSEITAQRPTNYVTEVTANMDQREKQLIVELSPVCNKKVG